MAGVPVSVGLRYWAGWRCPVGPTSEREPFRTALADAVLSLPRPLRFRVPLPPGTDLRSQRVTVALIDADATIPSGARATALLFADADRTLFDPDREEAPDERRRRSCG